MIWNRRVSRGAMNQWYYGENGQQNGPVDDSGFAALIASGRINAVTLVWREGMSGWLPYAQVLASGGMEIQLLPMTVSMMNPTTSGYAIASLVMGIVGLVTCVAIIGIPAVICGHMAINQIANSPVPMVGRGMAICGLVCGYLASLVTVVFLGFMIFGIAAAHPLS